MLIVYLTNNKQYLVSHLKIYVKRKLLLLAWRNILDETAKDIVKEVNNEIKIKTCSSGENCRMKTNVLKITERFIYEVR